MAPRLEYWKLFPEGITALRGVSEAVAASGLPRELIDLVYLRVSQLNGCAYCVELHSHDLRQAGVAEARLHQLVVWHESRLFSEAERVALAWAESLTRVGETHAPEADFAALGAHFTPAQITQLSVAIALMNAWNRIGVGFRQPPTAR
jgi:AhpD family alkylhydroperoxidase